MIQQIVLFKEVEDRDDVLYDGSFFFPLHSSLFDTLVVWCIYNPADWPLYVGIDKDGTLYDSFFSLIFLAFDSHNYNWDQLH